MDSGNTTSSYMEQGTVLEDNNETCVPVVRHVYIGLAAISLLEIAFNLTIIVAAIRGRRILRHNYVYAYVSSTLFANVALGFGSALNVLTNYLATENRRVDFKKPEDVAVMKWWAFRKSFNISVFLIMCASIAALIYGLRESSYFIGRFASNATLTEASSKKSSIRTRKNKAILIILAAWLIPCVFSLVPPLFGICLQNCQCHPAIYIDNVCQTNLNKHCSATWVPVSKWYLIAALTVWVVLIVFVVFLLLSTISTFIKAVSPTNKTTVAGKKTGSQWYRCFSCNCHRMNHSIKLLVFMTISYILFTAPAMAVLFIDILSLAGDLLTFEIVSAAFTLALVYTFVSPILLVRYMPGLRSALTNMFSQVGRTSTTAKRSTDTATGESVISNELDFSAQNGDST